MVNNRGVDVEVGRENRAVQALWKAIEDLRAERRAASTTVSTGDFTVEGGGGVVVNDGGGITVNDGGSVQVNEGGDVIVDGIGRRAVLSDGSLGVIDDNDWPSSFYKQDEHRILPGPGDDPVTFGYDPSTGAAMITGPGLIVPVLDTGSSANARIEGPGVLLRSTSSRRYKQDEEPADIEPAAVLQLVAKTWRQRSDVEADPDTQRRNIGFIAEDLDELGLTQFVEYDAEGQPDAIAYDRLSVALLAVLKDQDARLRALEAATTSQET